MDPLENLLQFEIIHGSLKYHVDISEYETVEDLKRIVSTVFEIPIQKQQIDGWKNTPEDDQTILKSCATPLEKNILTVRENANNLSSNTYNSQENEESSAAKNCVNKIFLTYGPWNLKTLTTTLDDALKNSCLAPLPEKKLLLLYLYKSWNDFSKIFWQCMKQTETVNILNSSCCVLCWDVTARQYIFKQALKKYDDLQYITEFIEKQIPAAIFINNMNGCTTVIGCITGKIKTSTFSKSIEEITTKFWEQREKEIELLSLEARKQHHNDIGSIGFQQLMADMLGDRDYDCFNFNQHQFLKDKIGFSLYGPPVSQEGYHEKQHKNIDTLYTKILSESNKISEYKNQVIISFIYNCVEPTLEEKLARSKKYEDYNPITDILPVPLFVLRKCVNSNDPCRIFIDGGGRVYTDWNDYLLNNNLHECKMVLPRNGRYTVDTEGKVELECHMSPACGLGAKLLKSIDIVSIGAGLASGGVFIAAIVTTVTPPLLLGAAVVGGATAFYSIGRAIYKLYDRSSHAEDMSFQNSEARGAYINILAGALGFVGPGANMVVATLAADGVNIGQGAIATVNALNVLNLGASGTGIVNSGYEVYCQWRDENQRPSLLTIVQLSSSILFFGNAVYNFKSATNIIEESQQRMLQDYQDNLRSNRHRKTFDKLYKETVRQNDGNQAQGRAEVIKTIRNIPNKDDVFAVLTRNNKNMNKNGVRFAAAGGEITLNGQSIDMSQFMAMSKKEVNIFLSNLPMKYDITAADTKLMTQIINKYEIPFGNRNEFLIYSITMLGSYDKNIRDLVMEILSMFMTQIAESHRQTLEQLFPNTLIHRPLLEMLLNFIATKAKEFEDRYQQWRQTRDPSYNPLFESADEDTSARFAKWFDYVVQSFQNHQNETIQELSQYFITWLSEQCYEYWNNREQNESTQQDGSPRNQITCSVCHGSTFVLS